jgi:hypothetical protein
MAETAAHLVDRVFPDVAVRQWVLALPHRVRFLCAYDPVLCRRIRRIFVRAIASFYQRRARARGLHDPRTGCVVFTQRFDSALRLNVHYHGLWLDGTFECASRAPRAEADFHPDLSPTGAEVAHLACALRRRTLRFLRKAGKLGEDDGLADLHDDVPPLLATLAAAAVQGRTALGPRAGAYAPRLGRGSADGGEFRRGKLCADAEGFSLHAGVRIAEYSRQRLEKLCRYAARPPVVHDRLQLRPDGKILYKLKRRYRDGSTHIVLEPLALLERLAALIPRPRVNLTTYHGILAPAASYRECVVPAPVDPMPSDSAAACAHAGARPHAEATPTPPPRSKPRIRYSWAELLQRVFLIDVLTCDRCGGRRKLLAAITVPKTVRRILAHLGLATEPPMLAPARAPPRELFG